MQLLKNKKFIIACIAVLLIAAAVIIVLVMNKKPSPELKKQYTDADGDMTLVDILDKDGEHEAKVYITSNQELRLEIKNAKGTQLYLKDKEFPISDTAQSLGLENSDIIYRVIIERGGSESDEQQTEDSGKFPCESEFMIKSDLSGTEYTIKLLVSDIIEYISGQFVMGEIDYSDLVEYDDVVARFGKVKLPEGAVLRDAIIQKEDYTVSENEKATIEQGVYSYILNGIEAEVVVLDSSNKKIFDGLKDMDEVKKLEVNGVEALVFDTDGFYIAIYTMGDYTYINRVFCLYNYDEEVKESELIEKLSVFIEK